MEAIPADNFSKTLLLDMEEITIHSKLRSFKVKFVDDFSFVDEFLKIPHYLVVTGSVLYKIYRQKIFAKFPSDKLLVLKINDQKKTLATVAKIYDKLLAQTARKNIVLISFGGGVNQDLTGFAASTIYRGINWIFIPTTLLAMADSAIGLKTSINYKGYKNIIGNFYPPSQVYINIDFLETLKRKDYYSGVGEITKMLLMQKNSVLRLDSITDFVNRLKKRDNKKVQLEAVKKSISIKKDYMKGDEFDTGRRNLLNFGHELGHALEAVSHFRIPHGLAVVIGMIFANIVSFNRGWITKEIYTRINKNLLLTFFEDRLIIIKKKYFDYRQLLEKMQKDKKRVSVNLPLILPKGKNFQLVKITDFDFAEFEKNLKFLLEIFKPYLV